MEADPDLTNWGPPMMCVVCDTCKVACALVSAEQYSKQEQLTEEQILTAKQFLAEHRGHDTRTEEAQFARMVSA